MWQPAWAIIMGTESVSVLCRRTLTSLAVVITVQKTVGARWTGMYNNFPGGTVSESHTDNGTVVTYTWRSINGQSIVASNNPYTAVAQFDLIGTAQPTSVDTYRVSYMASDGRTGILVGRFWTKLTLQFSYQCKNSLFFIQASRHIEYLYFFEQNYHLHSILERFSSIIFEIAAKTIVFWFFCFSITGGP